MLQLPLLIAPLKRRPLPPSIADRFANDYALGWLVTAEDGFRWVGWGSAASLQRALQVRDELLAERGPREVLIWHEILSEELTTEQVAAIRAAQQPQEGTEMATKKTPAEPKPEKALPPVAPAESALAEDTVAADVPAETPPDPVASADPQEDKPEDAPDAPAEEPEEPSLLWPVVGEIVHYRLPNGDIRPAIVTYVHSGETVDLSVLTGGPVDRSAIPERVVMINVNTGADHHAVPPVVFRPSVTKGDGSGQWDYLG